MDARVAQLVSLGWRRAQAALLDPPWPRFVRVAMGLSLGLLLVAAWRVDGFYHCDEHFQVLELMGTKLGWVETGGLPWEYPAQIRSWLQPFSYYLVIRALSLVFGLPSPFAAALICRVISAVVAWLAIWMFARCLEEWFEDGVVRRSVLLAANFFYLVPLLGSRTSGESFSQAFFLFGLGALILAERQAPDALLVRAFPSFFVAGLCFGMAFLFRFQVALMVVGVGLWYLVYGRRRLAFPLTGATAFVLVVLVGVLIDRWGYGEWVFSAWRYLKANIFENKAAEFGVLPWWGYFPLYWKPQIVRPLGFVLLVSLLLGPFVARRHVLTWATLPFFLAHVAIGHKETRFLFPALLCMMALGGLSLQAILAWRARLSSRRTQGLVTTGVVLVSLSLVAVNLKAFPVHLLRPRHRQVALLRALDEQAPRGWRVVWEGQDPINICGPNRLQLYAPDRWQAVELGTFPESETRLTDLPVFLSVTGTRDKIEKLAIPADCVWVGPYLLAPPWLDAHLRRFRLYNRALDWLGNEALYRCASDPQSHLPLDADRE
jgi:hypothetical protein